jgi:DNA-binding CsgD family transcriptional regulator
VDRLGRDEQDVARVERRRRHAFDVVLERPFQDVDDLFARMRVLDERHFLGRCRRFARAHDIAVTACRGRDPPRTQGRRVATNERKEWFSCEILESVIKTVAKTGSAVLSAPLMKTVVASLTKSANTSLSHSSGGEIKDLTPRELDFLRLMASGATSQEIGQALGISHETTRKHVTRIIDKLGARNRAHAAIISNHAAISGDD